MKSCLCLLALLTLNLVFGQAPAPAEAENMEKAPASPVAVNFSRDLEVPYLSIYYVEPVLTTDQQATFKYYVTDWYQSETRFKQNHHHFKVSLHITEQNTGKVYKKTAKKIPAGDHEIGVGNLPAGDYLLKLSAEDKQGRHSQTIYHQFRVRKEADLVIPEKDTFVMQESDLAKYGISKNGDYGIYHYIDATGKNIDETKALVEEAAKNMTVPAGKYLVVIGGSKTMDDLFVENCGAYGRQKPEWLPNYRSYQSSKVMYADDYDKEKVEAEALKTTKGLNALLKDVRNAGKRKLVFLPGVYRISHEESLEIPSGLTVDLNGATIKLNQNAADSGTMIAISDCIDSHVYNGIVEGDYFEHDYANAKNDSEWLIGIGIYGESKYCSFKDLTLRFITGYGAGNGYKDSNFDGFSKLKNYIPGTIDRKSGKVIPDVPGLYLSDMLPIDFLKDKFGCFTVSRTLGYQGIAMDSRNLMYHFFDADQKYLETVDGEQYRRVYPSGKAKFVRVTVWSKQMPNPEDVVQCNFFKIPQNCAFENLYIQNARAVGMAPSAMYNMKIANCTFVRSGETLAKCAFDAEDGWDMMQDVWIYRNRFIGNHHNGLLTCAGNNFVIEENQANDLYLWSRTNNYVVRNNTFHHAFLGYASRIRTGYCRVDNNKLEALTLGDSGNYDTRKAFEQFEKEMQGKGDVWNNARALVIYNDSVSNMQVACGTNGFYVDSELKNLAPGSTPNLYRSSLSDTRITHFAGPESEKSVYNNMDVTIAGASKKVYNMVFNNSRIFIQNHVKLEFYNCTFNNSSIVGGYWISPDDIKFENCNVTADQEVPLVRLATYTVGNIEFKNTRFKMEKSSPVFFFDQRKFGPNDQPGYIRFENCEIETGKGLVIDKTNEPNEKPLKFELKSTIYNGKIMDNPQGVWTITEQPAGKDTVIEGNVGWTFPVKVEEEEKPFFSIF